MYRYIVYQTIEFEDGYVFELDYARRLLRDVDHPGRVMLFSQMKDHGTHYSFYYDTHLHQMQQQSGSGSIVGKDCYAVELPALTHRAELLAYEYGVELSDVKGKTDREFFECLPQIRQRQHELVLRDQDLELIRLRQQGNLPTLKIGSVVHVVDWAQKLVYNRLDPTLKADFSSFGRGPDGSEYSGLFSFQKGEIFPKGFSRDKTFDICAIVIPSERVLDPIGVARDLGFHDLDLLYKHPIQKEICASVYHLPTEKITEMFVRQNRKQQKRGMR